MRRIILAFLLFAIPVAARGDDAPCDADVRQAEAFLRLLAACGPDACDDAALSSFLQLHGTELIIAQQNISRSITAANYRETVKAGLLGTTPQLAPADPASARAKRGIEGLLNDVYPSIRWATQHRDVLTERLERLRGVPLCDAAKKRAERYLPRRSDAPAALRIVMGGRAGASAIGNEIYFDVLAASYRAAKGGDEYPSGEEIIDYFAHELHHVYYGGILQAERRRRGSKLSPPEAAAYDVLESLLMEGSATYFVNLHRDTKGAVHDATLREELSRASATEKAIDELLRGTLSGSLSGSSLEAAQAALAGSALHAAGATMLAEIDHALGYRAVQRVMLQPRLFLVTYNRAARKQRARHPYLFSEQTASAVANIGH